MQNINTKTQNKIMQDMMLNGTGMFKIQGMQARHIPILKTFECQTTISRRQIRKLAIKYKENKMPKDNNCKENHKRGLKKRKEMFGIQETVHSLKTRKRLVELNQFYGRTLKMLKLA